MLLNLKERRKQKLLTYIAYGKILPVVIPEEEEALYEEIRAVLDKSAEPGVSKMRVVSSIPEVLTAEGRKIGPYKQGEIIEIGNSRDVEFMIKNKIAEPVNQ